MLMAKRIPITIIDSEPEQIEVSQEFGTKVYYGDGTRIDLLRIAGAETAEAILFCQDPDALSKETLEAILDAFPQAQLLVRVFDRRQVIEFDGLDLAYVQREMFESAVIMGRNALVKLGITRLEAERVEARYRALDEERLERQSETGDLRAAMDRMFGVDRPLADEQAKDSA
jgi:glutathione-regulated potassium-efflux system protein KefB